MPCLKNKTHVSMKAQHHLTCSVRTWELAAGSRLSRRSQKLRVCAVHLVFSQHRLLLTLSAHSPVRAPTHLTLGPARSAPTRRHAAGNSPAGRPAGKHTAAAAGGAAPCGAARCSPAAAGGAAPRGWHRARGARPWSSWQRLSGSPSCRGSAAAGACRAATSHPGSPAQDRQRWGLVAAVDSQFARPAVLHTILDACAHTAMCTHAPTQTGAAVLFKGIFYNEQNKLRTAPSVSNGTTKPNVVTHWVKRTPVIIKYCRPVLNEYTQCFALWHKSADIKLHCWDILKLTHKSSNC